MAKQTEEDLVWDTEKYVSTQDEKVSVFAVDNHVDSHFLLPVVRFNFKH